jgi:hypothetical protein
LADSATGANVELAPTVPKTSEPVNGLHVVILRNSSAQQVRRATLDYPRITPIDSAPSSNRSERDTTRHSASTTPVPADGGEHAAWCVPGREPGLQPAAKPAESLVLLNWGQQGEILTFVISKAANQVIVLYGPFC